MVGREDKGVENESHFLDAEGNYETVPNSGSPQQRPPLEREAGTSSRQREEDQAVTMGQLQDILAGFTETIKDALREYSGQKSHEKES